VPRACRLRSFPTSPTKADSLTRNPGTGKSPEPADRNVCPTSEAEIDLGNSGAPISDPARFCWNLNTCRAGGRRSGGAVGKDGDGVKPRKAAPRGHAA
jgi:hypothetical protein